MRSPSCGVPSSSGTWPRSSDLRAPVLQGLVNVLMAGHPSRNASAAERWASSNRANFDRENARRSLATASTRRPSSRPPPHRCPGDARRKTCMRGGSAGSQPDPGRTGRILIFHGLVGEVMPVSHPVEPLDVVVVSGVRMQQLVVGRPGWIGERSLDLAQHIRSRGHRTRGGMRPSGPGRGPRPASRRSTVPRTWPSPPDGSRRPRRWGTPCGEDEGSSRPRPPAA